jgi:type IV pilus assembly protein PilO
LAPDFKDPRVQKFLLAGIFLCGLFYAYYSLVYQVQTGRIDILQARLTRIDRHVRHARQKVEGHDIDGLKREVNTLESQLRVLERLLPPAEEVPDLLEMVERKGIQSGISAILFEPAGSRRGQLYEERVYNVSVRGGYHEIGGFLSMIGSSPRIVRTSRLNVVSQDQEAGRKGRVVAKFELSTFILSEGQPAEDSGKHEEKG